MIDQELMLSETLKDIKPSGIRKFFDLLADMGDVTALTVGQPDFVTPWHIREAAIQSLERGHTYYTSNSGLPELRSEIAKYMNRRFGLEYSPGEVLVTVGGSEAIDVAVRALVNPGDEVIIPSHYWLTYPELVKLAGGKCVYAKTEAKNGYKITAKELEEKITSKTKCLILNSPNNPTGAVYSLEELKAIASVVEKANIFVISDEIYEKLIYDGEKHYSIASLSEYMKEHTIVVNGMSKSYAMTGWRIGYLAAPTVIAKAISSMQSHTSSNPNSIAQYASVTALADKEGVAFIDNMQKVFDKRRKLMIDILKDVKDVKCITPKGAFYVFADVSSFYGKKFEGQEINGSLSFADAALKKGVALIPGVAFGEDNCIRFSYAISDEDIKEGLNRFIEFLGEIK